MANILITYADDAFHNAAWRLKHLGRETGFFDKIKIYRPADLPVHVKASPLFQFKRGGGYWVWKPYIINDALSHAKTGDVVYYVDAGCRINPQNDDWSTYHRYIDDGYDSIFFQYRNDYNYPWDRFGFNSVALRHWIKPSTSGYFTEYFGTDAFMDMPKIWGGFIIMKKVSRNIILDEWLCITLFHPELVMDPFGQELERVNATFNEHRHDQSIITPLVWRYCEQAKALVLPESGEAECDKASVVAERYKAGKMSWLKTLKYKLYYLKNN